MSNATNPKVNSAATMKAMAYSGFPASSLVHLYDELLASDGNDAQVKAYRDLFHEMRAEGDVPHNRSILSPAAYFTDLLRMVLCLENPELPKSRKLLTRRPDLREIKLDEENTTTEAPYLTFTNGLLRGLLKTQRDALKKAGGSPRELVVLDRNHAVSRVRSYLDSVDVDFADIVATISDTQGQITSARLGLGQDDLAKISKTDAFFDFSSAIFTRERLQTTLDGPELPRILAQLGVSEDTLDLVLGSKTTVLADVMQRTVPGLADAGPICFERKSTGPGTFKWILTAAGKPVFGHKVPADPSTFQDKVLAAYQNAIAEILRYSHLAEGLGISARDLDAVAFYIHDTTFATDFIDQAASILALAKRFDLKLEEATLINGSLSMKTAIRADGTASHFGRLFPNGVATNESGALTAGTTAAAGINQNDARMVVHFMAAQTDGETSPTRLRTIADDTHKTLAAIFRMHRLSALLKVPLVDLLSVAHLLGTDIHAQKDILELIDYVDWMTAKKLPIDHLLAMAQKIETPTCKAADILTVNTVVQHAFSASTAAPDEQPLEVAIIALSSFYALEEKRILGFLDAMDDYDSDFADDFFNGFIDNSFADIDENLPLPKTANILAFCMFQRLIAVTTTYTVPTTLLRNDDEVADKLGFKGPHKFCKIRDLRSLSRLKDLSEVRGYDVVERYRSTVLSANNNDKDEALAKILGTSVNMAAEISRARDPDLEHTGQLLLSDRAGNIVEGLAWMEHLSRLATTLGVDMGVLIDAAKLTSPAYAPGLITRSPDKDGIETKCNTFADIIRDTVQAHDPKGWKINGNAIEGPMLEKERDGLVATLLWDLSLSKNSNAFWPFGRPKNADDLSDVLLVDVQMGGASQISAIKLGLNSLQRYIQRVQTGKEGEPRPFEVDQAAWTWRSHYRIWESNRKSFLFPENYLDPGLRRRKTPLFQDIEDALLQSEIDDDSVTHAYMDYFDKLLALSTLEIVGTCPARVTAPGNKTAQNTLFVLGRTAGEKPDYYLRSAVFEGPDELLFWRPWEKVNFPVHSRQVVVGYVNHRVHLFWLDERVVTDQHEGEKVTRTYVTLRYSHQLHRSGWSDAQSVEEFSDQLIGSITIDSKAATATAGVWVSDQLIGSITIDSKAATATVSVEGSRDQLIKPITAAKADEDANIEAKTLERMVQNEALANKAVSEFAKGKPYTFPPGGSEHGELSVTVTAVVPDITKLKLPSKGLDGPKGLHITADISAPLDLQSMGILDAEPDQESGPTWAADYSLVSPLAPSTINKEYGATTDTDTLEITDVVLGGEAPNGGKRLFHAIVREPGTESCTLAHRPVDKDDWTLSRGQDRGFDKFYVPVNSDHIFVRNSHDNRLYVSQAWSGKWTALPKPDSHIKDGIFDVAVSDDGQKIAMITGTDSSNSNERAVFTSPDMGRTWNQVDTRGLIPGCLIFNTADGKDELVLASGGALRLGVAQVQVGDLSGNWTRIKEFKTDADHIPVAMHRVGRNEYLLGMYATLYRTTDGGVHWDPVIGNGRGDEVNITKIRQKPFCNVFLKLEYIKDSDQHLGWYEGRFYTGGEEGRLYSSIGTMATMQEAPNSITTMASTSDGKAFLVGTSRKGLQFFQPARAVASFPKGNQYSEYPHLPHLQISDARTEKHSIIPFGTAAVQKLSRRLSTRGLEAMLSLASQKDVIDEANFQSSAAYADYYREVFFHIPYLIADTLNKHGKFAEAQKWYEHIFRPKMIGDDTSPDDKTPYWRYAPFKGYELRHLLTFNSEEFTLYESDPFDAHAIAAIRMGAYEKAVVMRYIDNLLDWGDQLFAQDSWENISLAMSHYNLARDLLGTDPRHLSQAGNLPKPVTFSQLFPDDKISGVDIHDSFHLEDRKNFPFPVNTAFGEYWTRTSDRLQKIRASEDIRGAKRTLSLFQPPIDPRVIMGALASGMSLKDATSAAASARPIYRFSGLLARARNAAQNVVSLGNALQSALEKKDAEGLAQLHAKHDRNIQLETGQRLEATQKSAQLRVDTLNKRRAEADQKRAHFKSLQDGSLLAPERLAMKMKNDAYIMSSTTAAIRSASAAGYAVPCIFGFSDGGQDIGKVIDSAAQAIDSASGAVSQSAGMAESRGQNDRRAQDWGWQYQEAEADIVRADDEIKSARLALELSVLETSLHEAAVARSDTMAAYVADKFTNKELYTWLSGKLMSLISSSFQMALGLAKDAEAVHRWERCDNDTYIIAPDVASKRGNLVAGEELLLSLACLERAHMSMGARHLQFQKTISLKTAKHDDRLVGLCDDWSAIHNGSIDFSLLKTVFKDDGAGDAYRRIKSVAITMPAIVGPYQSVSAILTQTKHHLLLGGDPSMERTNESVAISTALNDHGVHELDFKSELFQPFEGKGAVSDWHISLSQDINNAVQESISDVVIHIRYTAQPTQG